MVAWIPRRPLLYGSGAVLLICPRCAFVLRGTQDEVCGRNLLAVFSRPGLGIAAAWRNSAGVVICGATSSAAWARRLARVIRMGASRAVRLHHLVHGDGVVFPEHSPRVDLRKWGFPLALLTYRVKK